MSDPSLGARMERITRDFHLQREPSFRALKLAQIEKSEGREIMEIAEEATFDSVAVGICTELSCDCTAHCEPDATANYCEACGRQSVVSVLVLLGLI